MQFTSVTNKKFINYKETEPNTIIATGKLISTSPNKYNADNSDYQIKPSDGGPVINLFGAGHLAWGMSSVSIGDTVQVTYLGTEKMEGGTFKGTDAHQFDVALGDTSTVEEIVDADKADKAVKANTVAKATSTGTVDLSDLD